MEVSVLLLLVVAALAGALTTVVVERTIPPIPNAPHALSQALGFFVMLAIGWRRSWGIRGPEIGLRKQFAGALLGSLVVFVVRWLLP